MGGIFFPSVFCFSVSASPQGWPLCSTAWTTVEVQASKTWRENGLWPEEFFKKGNSVVQSVMGEGIPLIFLLSLTTLPKCSPSREYVWTVGCRKLSLTFLARENGKTSSCHGWYDYAVVNAKNNELYQV